VDTFLTLVIALGGIATGIGAIWTAMLARRQLSEQRRFLEEQNEIARSQARLTEQSLAEQRQSFQEQTGIARSQSQLTERSLVEQNERARLNLELDLLGKLRDRFESRYFLSRRRRAAAYATDGFAAEGDIAQAGRFNRAAYDVANFFEDLGYLQRIGALREETVYHSFGIMARTYWTLYGNAIREMREEHGDPELYEDFERLDRRLADLERERGIEPLTQARVLRIMKDETIIGEESPTTEE
jgi:hypothetical protein